MLARAGHRDALAEERQGFKPVQLFPQPNHLAEHGDGRGFEPRLDRQVGDVGESAHQGLLGTGGGPAHEGGGRLGVQSGGLQPGRDGAEPLDAHEHDFRSRGAGDGFEVEGGLRLGGIFVSGENCQGGVVGSMSDRDARVGGSGEGGTHTGHDLITTAGRSQGLGLLAAPAEQKRVAALEPRHGFSRAGFFDQHVIDSLLRKRVGPGFLARVDFLGRLRGEFQQERIAQIIVDHHVRTLEAVTAFEGQQAGIAGAGADEITDSFLHRKLRGLEQRFEACFVKVTVGRESGLKPQLLHENKTRAIRKRIALIGVLSKVELRCVETLGINEEHSKKPAGFGQIQHLQSGLRTAADRGQRESFIQHVVGQNQAGFGIVKFCDQFRCRLMGQILAIRQCIEAGSVHEDFTRHIVFGLWIYSTACPQVRRSHADQDATRGRLVTHPDFPRAAEAAPRACRDG